MENSSTICSEIIDSIYEPIKLCIQLCTDHASPQHNNLSDDLTNQNWMKILLNCLYKNLGKRNHLAAQEIVYEEFLRTFIPHETRIGPFKLSVNKRGGERICNNALWLCHDMAIDIILWTKLQTWAWLLRYYITWTILLHKYQCSQKLPARFEETRSIEFSNLCRQISLQIYVLLRCRDFVDTQSDLCENVPWNTLLIVHIKCHQRYIQTNNWHSRTSGMLFLTIILEVTAVVSIETWNKRPFGRLGFFLSFVWGLSCRLQHLSTIFRNCRLCERL